MFIHSENPLSNIYMSGTYAKKYGSRNPQGVKVHIVSVSKRYN